MTSYTQSRKAAAQNVSNWKEALILVSYRWIILTEAEMQWKTKPHLDALNTKQTEEIKILKSARSVFAQKLSAVPNHIKNWFLNETAP